MPFSILTYRIDHGTTDVGIVFKNHLVFNQVKAGNSRLETQYFIQQERGSTGAQKVVNATDQVVNAAFI